MHTKFGSFLPPSLKYLIEKFKTLDTLSFVFMTVRESMLYCDKFFFLLLIFTEANSKIYSGL
jgi:hypothetical protein